MGRWCWYPLFLLIGCAWCEEKVESLYAPSDHLLVLDAHNFYQNIYNQKRAFFVEFYSSWCGACISYAPTFKQLARQLQSWSSVVQIAVVNCASEENLSLCRKHTVDAYPTLRYFKYMSKDDPRTNFNGDKRNVDNVSKILAQYVYEDWRQQRPLEWPNFDPIDSGTTVSDVWKRMTDNVSLLALIVENEPATTAWAEMIAFANENRVHVVLAAKDHPSSRALDSDPSGQAAKLVVFNRNSDTPVHLSNDQDTLFSMQEKIRALLSDAPGQTIAGQGTLRRQEDHREEEAKVNWSQFEVQLQDVITALYYMLKAEIPRKQVIAGENLQGLKLWLHALKMYGPGTIPMRRLFYRLDKWIQSVATEITAEQWLAHVDSIQDQLGHPLPSNSSYMACRGTKPHLRGFACGIWTLIHSMSVEAYKAEKNNESFSAASNLIEPFHQFIWHFFSCRECAQHFHDGILKRNISVVVTPKAGVLWLWRTHNIVNKFTAKTESEDPAFPKLQFPSTALCANCRRPSNEFDEDAVFGFLLNYYGNMRTDSLKVAPGYKVSNFNDGKLIAVERKHMNAKFQVAAFDVDELEASEQQQLTKDQFDTSPQRKWRELNLNDFDGRSELNSASSSIYVLWLSVVAVVPAVIGLVAN